jgi:hypothetical protein
LIVVLESLLVVPLYQRRSNGCGNRSNNQAIKELLLERWVRQSRQESGRQRVIVGAMGAAIAATTRLSKGDCWSNGCGNRSKNKVFVGAMGAAIAATTRLSKSKSWSDGCDNRSKNQAVKG